LSGSLALYLEPALDVLKGRHLVVAPDNSVQAGQWFMVRLLPSQSKLKVITADFKARWDKIPLKYLKSLVEKSIETGIGISGDALLRSSSRSSGR
jgi:hypothetical protein